MPTVAELSIDVDANDNATATLERIDALLQRLAGNDTNIPLDLTGADATEAELQFIQDALFEIDSMTVQVPVEVDDQATAQLAQIQTELDALQNRVEAGVDLDAAAAEAELLALREQLQELQRNPVNVDLDTGMAQAKVLEIEALLKAIPDEKVTVEIDEDTQVVDRLKNITSAASRASTQISAMATAILVLGPALAPILGVALAAAGGLAAALVAAGAGAALFAGVAITNFGPVAEALKRMDQLQKQYNNAVTDKQRDAALDKMKTTMESLDPAQRAMAEGITALASEWTKFATQFQPQVFQLAGDGLQFIAALIPKFAPLMNGMLISAQNLQDALKAAFDSPWMAKFSTEISRLAGPIFQDLMKGLGNIGLGFLGIINAFLPFSTSVSGGFVKMTADFAAWGQALANNPGFTAFMNYVRANIPTVIGFVKSLWSAFIELVKAIAPLGGAVLAGVTALLNGITWLGKNAPMVLTLVVAISGLVAIFINLLGPILSIISVFTRLGALLGMTGGWAMLVVVSIVAIIAALVLAYMKVEWFRNAVNAVASAIMGFAQAAIPVIVSAFQTLMQWGEQAWAWLTATFGPAIAAVVDFVVAEFEKFSAWFSENQATFTEFWNIILEEISGVWTLIVNVVTIAVQFIVDFVTGAWGGLVNIVQGIWTALSGVISGALAIIRGIISVFVGIITGDWSMAWNGLVTILGGIWTAIWAVLRGAFQVVIGIFQVAWAAIVAVWNALWSAVKAILQPTIDWIKEVWQNVYDFLIGNSIIPDIVNGIIQWFTQAWTFIQSIFTAIWTFLVTIWTNIKTAVIDAIKLVLLTVVETMTTLQNAWNTAWTTIGNFLQTAWTNIKTWVLDGVKVILLYVVDFIRDAQDKWDTFWTAFGQAVVDGAKAVLKFFEDMGANIMNFLSGLKDKMIDAGAALVQGLIDGLGKMLGPLGTMIGKVADVLAKPLPGSPAEIGPLSGSGYSKLRAQRMVQDFGAGIESQLPSLGLTMRDLADMAALSMAPKYAYSQMTGSAGGASVQVAAGAVQVTVGSGADAAMVKGAIGAAGTDLATQINDALRRR